MERSYLVIAIILQLYSLCWIITPVTSETTIELWGENKNPMEAKPLNLAINKREVSNNGLGKVFYNYESVGSNSINGNPEKRFFSRLWVKSPKSEGYKRGPGFRSWGGKRSVHTWPEEKDDDTWQWVKRARFGSWGGKRDDTIKRKFSNWGGKRTLLYSTENNNEAFESPLNEKRAIQDDEYIDFVTDNNSFDKRHKFVSWGGKRDGRNGEQIDGGVENSNTEENAYEARNQDVPLITRELLEKKSLKPQKFQSWGGKRAIYWSLYDPYYVKEKNLRRFLNWEGKRKFSSWGGKRANLNLNNTILHRFQDERDDNFNHQQQYITE